MEVYTLLRQSWFSSSSDWFGSTYCPKMIHKKIDSFCSQYWTSIVINGRTLLYVIVLGIMTFGIILWHINKILVAPVSIFRDSFSKIFCFIADKTLRHCTTILQDCFDNDGTQRLARLSYSSDLNPIVNVWNALAESFCTTIFGKRKGRSHECNGKACRGLATLL